MAVDKPAELRVRCRASADRIAVLREELAAEKSRRDQMVIEMRDAGTHWRDIAGAARLSVTQCVTIVTGAPTFAFPHQPADRSKVGDYHDAQGPGPGG